MSRDSQRGEAILAARGYRVERRDENIFYVTGRDNA